MSGLLTMPVERQAARPVALACLQCRSKHLKCNADTPVCSRCKRESIQCAYAPSQRGYRRQRKAASRSGSVASSEASETVFTSIESGMSSSLSSGMTHFEGIMTTAPLSALNHQILHKAAAHRTTSSIPPAERPRFIASYYFHFHPSHPFLVPQAFYGDQGYSEDLETAVCQVGRFYIMSKSHSAMIQAATDLMLYASPERRTTPSYIQALTIYSILLHSLQQTQLAQLCISRAAESAISLGLNRPDFARAYATSAVNEESLRRTWWELYIVETYLAVLHRTPKSQFDTIEQLPLLPCIENAYTSGGCNQQSPSLTNFEARFFTSESSIQYSTFCYRIESIRLMRRLLPISQTNDSDIEGTQNLDNALASWKYHLPQEHSQLVDERSKLNQHVFHACTFVYCTSIFLHFPRSNLPFTVPSTADIECMRDLHTAKPTEANHTLKAIAASKEICTLATTPGAVEQSSPLFVCAVILAGVVQLAAACIHGKDCIHGHKDRVILVLGVLLQLGERWPVARNASRQMRILADAIFVTPESPRYQASQSSKMVLDSFPENMDWLDFFSSDPVPDGLGSLNLGA